MTATQPTPCPAEAPAAGCTECGYQGDDVRYDWGTESALCNRCWFGKFPTMQPRLHAIEPTMIRGAR